MTVVSFPGHKAPDQATSPDEDEINVTKVLDSFKANEEKFDEILIIAVSKNGAISWGSSSDDLRSILWLSKAIERIIMDTSLGLVDPD
jgi:hypothetical protein